MTPDDLRAIALRATEHDGHGRDDDSCWADRGALLALVRQVAESDPLAFFDNHRGQYYECHHCDGEAVDFYGDKEKFKHADSCLWLISQGAKP